MAKVPRGRKPKPHLRVMDEQEGEDPIGPPPDHLDELGRWFWVEAAKELDDMGLVTSAARFELEHMAVLYSNARICEQIIKDEGRIFICSRTHAPKRHPASIEAHQCRKELRLMSEAIGLSFTGRARSSNKPPKPKKQPPSPYTPPKSKAEA